MRYPELSGGGRGDRRVIWGSEPASTVPKRCDLVLPVAATPKNVDVTRTSNLVRRGSTGLARGASLRNRADAIAVFGALGTGEAQTGVIGGLRRVPLGRANSRPRSTRLFDGLLRNSSTRSALG
jgi:hypothetical protein